MADANASEPEKVLRFVNELDQSAAQSGVVIADTVHRLLPRADRAVDLEVAVAEGVAARAVLHRVQVLASPGPIVVFEALHDHHRAAENGLEIGGRERVVGVEVARLAQLRGQFPAAGRPRVGDVDDVGRLLGAVLGALAQPQHVLRAGAGVLVVEDALVRRDPEQHSVAAHPLGGKGAGVVETVFGRVVVIARHFLAENVARYSPGAERVTEHAVRIDHDRVLVQHRPVRLEARVHDRRVEQRVDDRAVVGEITR